MFDYVSVTELAGDEVSQEQVFRICNRYYWAVQYCKDKDVLEVACGTGQGLGLLAKNSKSLIAGDYSDRMLDIAKSHYKNRIDLRQFDAQKLPFPDNYFDVVIMFEAIYYLPDAKAFVLECKRVLRPSGMVLIATANKDLFDFNPSPYSYQYYGTIELNNLFAEHGFMVELYGGIPISWVSFRQKIFRPIKKLAVMLNLIPESMESKKVLKRIVFGKLVKMPAEIEEGIIEYVPPVRISCETPDTKHKVIYCVATLA